MAKLNIEVLKFPTCITYIVYRVMNVLFLCQPRPYQYIHEGSMSFSKWISPGGIHFKYTLFPPSRTCKLCPLRKHTPKCMNFGVSLFQSRSVFGGVLSVIELISILSCLDILNFPHLSLAQHTAKITIQIQGLACTCLNCSRIFTKLKVTMPRANRTGEGRIRFTDDTAVLVLGGADVEVRAEHLSAVNATKTNESSDDTQKGHRRRLKKMIEWWMTEYPDYFVVGTRASSPQEMCDPMKFFHTCDRDIVYDGLRVDMVTAYMAATKKRMLMGLVRRCTRLHIYERFMMPYSSVREP